MQHASTRSMQQPRFATTAGRSSSPTRRGARVVDTPPLVQFVVLSMLLHVLLIVLFGNPTGSTRRSDGWQGPLAVTLGLEPQSGTGLRLAPGLDVGQPGSALPPSESVPNEPIALRPGGTQRPLEPPAPAETSPPLLRSAPEEAERRSLSSPVPSPAKIEPGAPPDRQLQLAPPLELPSRAAPTLPVVPVEKATPPRSEPLLSPPVELPPQALPQAPRAPLERPAPPAPARELAPAVQLPPREEPAAPGPPLERLAPARIERQIAQPVEAPSREAPAAPAAPIEHLAPAPTEPEIAPPVALPPRVAPAAPAAPIEHLAPAPIEPEIAPPVAMPPRAAPVAPAPIERVAPARIEREIAPPASMPVPGAEPRAPTTVPSAQPQAPATERPTPPRGGLPDVNEDIFRARRDAGAPPGEAPHIDLEAARKKAAREIVSEGTGSRGIFTVPPPPERKSKEAGALDKAIKPDCRTAYANMGLLAAPVLIASAIAADGSCRW